MADLEILAEFTAAVGYESEGLRPNMGVVRTATQAALDDPSKARYFVADDGELVGSLFVTYEWSDWNNGWYWWIQAAYVVPNRRRQGVFAAMYQAVQAAAKEAGNVHAVRLYVDADNVDGLATYAQLGMKETNYRVFEAKV